MRSACVFLAGLLALAPWAFGQTVQVYLEDFPNAGGTADIPVSDVGWANDIPAANPNRLAYGETDPNDGLVWAWEPEPGAGVTNTTAFYTSTALDTGGTGQAFAGIDPTAYINVEFHSRIRDAWDADNMATRFAVQMDGGSWYVSTNALPVPYADGGSSGIPFTDYGQVFTTNAAAWLNLTVSGDGTGTGAVIGAIASVDLTGEITGAGLVVQHWDDDGTHQFDDFQLRVTPFGDVPPSIEQDPVARSVYEGENVTFSVVAAGTAPIGYQWRESGTPISDSGNVSGSATPDLRFFSVTMANVGAYDVVVTNVAGAVTSAVATLTVSEPPAALLYEELFPHPGGANITVDAVGWMAAIATQPTRLYEWPEGDGNVYAYEGGVATTAFYTTTETDTGATGPAFNPIDPDAVPAVTLDVEIEPGWNSANVEARMAVRMAAGSVAPADLTGIFTTTNGDLLVTWDGGPNATLQSAPAMSDAAEWTDVEGTTGANSAMVPAPDAEGYFRTLSEGASWYVAANPLPVNHSLGATVQYHAFDRGAAGWNLLTVGETSAAIGGPATGDLAGDIVGAGLVFVHSDAGTLNFDNFRVTTNPAPTAVPVIVWLPQSLTAYEGAGVSFAVTATGTEPFAYQWSREFVPLSDGGRISGSTTDVVTITGITPGDAGEYSAEVSNEAGSDDSFYLQIHDFFVVPVPAGMLYAEQFPFVGPGAVNKPLGLVGWAADVPSSADRLWKVSGEGTNDAAGASFAYESGPAESMIYTTAALDTGVSGLPFTPLAFGTTYPSLDLSADIAPSYGASNVTARFAVQIDGADWYASAATLPVPGVDSEVFSTYVQNVTPAAAGWNAVTLTGSGVEVGDGAAGDLVGSLTGVGVVFTHTGEGTLDMDNVEINLP